MGRGDEVDGNKEILVRCGRTFLQVTLNPSQEPRKDTGAVPTWAQVSWAAPSSVPSPRTLRLCGSPSIGQRAAQDGGCYLPAYPGH